MPPPLRHQFCCPPSCGKAGGATTPSKRCCKQRIEVNTLEFSAQQGLLERFDRFVHFESLAQCRLSYGTNIVAAQAAERVTNAKTPSKRCCKQRMEVNTLAFSAQQGLLQRLDRFVHFEPLGERRCTCLTNFVATQPEKRVGNAKNPSERCSKGRIEVETMR